MKHKRSSGILLHLTSLGGDFGSGTLGKYAYDFVDFLHDTGTAYWQILPFNPVAAHYGYSPYAALSTFAGNPLLIDYQKLINDYSFCSKYMLPESVCETDYADFDSVAAVNRSFLGEAFSLFKDLATDEEIRRFKEFRESQALWLEDYALFRSLADHFNTTNWLEWDDEIAHRSPSTVKECSEKFSEQIYYHSFVQFIFFEQWKELKEYCGTKGVKLIGDLPIYVSFDSADAWAHPDIFLTDTDGVPDPVAGVPPDYFSETGQRWGNPIYDWFNDDGTLKTKTADWWKRRMAFQREMVDLIRIDHFRAFESYWAIPQTEETAINGSWEKGPGALIFDYFKQELGELDLIAEDLGIIDDKVRELRDGLNLPGMRIMHFAFDKDSDNLYLPHNIENQDTVLYTGTHDNNTTVGWYFETLNQELKEYVRYYLNIESEHNFHQNFIRSAFRTVAKLCILPAQDLLGLPGKFRMNAPGTMGATNWRWRLRKMNDLTVEKEFLKDLNLLYGRSTIKQKEKEDQTKEK